MSGRDMPRDAVRARAHRAARRERGALRLARASDAPSAPALPHGLHAAAHRLPRARRARSQVVAKLQELAGSKGVAWDDDKAVTAFLQESADAVDAATRELAFGAVSEQLETLIAPLDSTQRAELLAFLSSKAK